MPATFICVESLSTLVKFKLTEVVDLEFNLALIDFNNITLYLLDSLLTEYVTLAVKIPI